MYEIFEAIGVIGLILIIFGIFVKRKRQSELFIAGGICLEIYSIFIGDWIFIALQAAFTIGSVYEFFTLRKSKRL